MTYQDKHGYKREPSNLVHRHRAYHYIYLKDRKKYPLPFEAYEIHHIDGNKDNNRMDNLAVLTPEEHDKATDIMESYGLSVEEFWNIKLTAEKDYGVNSEQLFKDFEDLCEKIQRKEIVKVFFGDAYSEGEIEEKMSSEQDENNYFKKCVKEHMRYIPTKPILVKTWNTLFENYKAKIKEKEEAEKKREEEAEEGKRRKERNEKIKARIKGGLSKLFGKKK